MIGEKNWTSSYGYKTKRYRAERKVKEFNLTEVLVY